MQPRLLLCVNAMDKMRKHIKYQALWIIFSFVLAILPYSRLFLLITHLPLLLVWAYYIVWGSAILFYVHSRNINNLSLNGKSGCMFIITLFLVGWAGGLFGMIVIQLQKFSMPANSFQLLYMLFYIFIVAALWAMLLGAGFALFIVIPLYGVLRLINGRNNLSRISTMVLSGTGGGVFYWYLLASIWVKFKYSFLESLTLSFLLAFVIALITTAQLLNQSPVRPTAR